MPCSPCCPHCRPQSKADTQFIGHGICTSASTSCTAVSEDEVHVPPPRQKQKSRQVSEVQHALASSQLDTAPCDKEVKNQQQQTAAEVAAAAGVVAAAAALQVIQAAGEQVEAQLQVHIMCPWCTLCKGFLHLAHRLNLANSVSSSSDSCCCTHLMTLQSLQMLVTCSSLLAPHTSSALCYCRQPMPNSRLYSSLVACTLFW